MSMRIGSSMSAGSKYYNSGYDPGRDLSVDRVNKINPVEEAKRVDALRQQKAENLLSGNRGVIQTKVSPENSFQKAMVTDPGFAYERMAGKLLDKLPVILKDMQNLPETTDFAERVASAKEAASSKVVISENGRVNGQPAADPETENISL